MLCSICYMDTFVNCKSCDLSQLMIDMYSNGTYSIWTEADALLFRIIEF